MRDKQMKTAENSSYGQNWRESTDFRVVIMNSKRQVNGKLCHAVRIHVCRLPFAVHAKFNLSNVW